MRVPGRGALATKIFDFVHRLGCVAAHHQREEVTNSTNIELIESNA